MIQNIMLALLLLLCLNGTATAAGEKAYAEGMEAVLAKDYARALPILRSAAEAGHAKAQYSLGLRYILGQGAEKDEIKAAKWFRLASEQNLPEAQYSLAIRFILGQGVQQDHHEAAAWLAKAAAHKYAEAQYKLATLYALGQGVNQDYVRAYAFATLAARQDNEHGKQLVKTLEPYVSQDQRNAALELISQQSQAE
ncbi:MAG: tetratricopeptide repeat protein [Mariprofundaceae bacterium]